MLQPCSAGEMKGWGNGSISGPLLVGWLDVLCPRTVPSGPEQLESRSSRNRVPACPSKGAIEQLPSESAAGARPETRSAVAACESADSPACGKTIQPRVGAPAQAHVWDDSGF